MGRSFRGTLRSKTDEDDHLPSLYECESQIRRIPCGNGEKGKPSPRQGKVACGRGSQKTNGMSFRGSLRSKTDEDDHLPSLYEG